MSSSNILLEKKDKTLIITLNRPEVFNALNTTGKLEIIKTIREANRDDSIFSIILSAAGKAFCSGQDLNDRTVNASEGNVDIGRTLETEWNPLVQVIRQSEKLIIAAISGVCAGAGLSVALSCDLKIASPDVKFYTGFSKIGLAPDAGLSYMLVRQMGYSKALSFSVMGKALFSEDMLRYNLINEVVSDSMARALEICAELNLMAPLALRITKKNLIQAQDLDFNQMMEREKYTQRFLGNSKDYQEGISAFFEKRSAQFKGN